MDFHSLSRRELQAYCKKNKIPANMTNVAMADALKALKIVEGIEECMQQPSQSESAQSSIESLENSEVTSPYVPPTGGRSTRRRAVKDDLECMTSVTTTRRTTRKPATNVSDDKIETPTVAAQASRRKVQMASACRKMDSQLKECVEEEKKEYLTTPAPVGMASRRGKVEVTEKKVYSTRRSVRLAVKNVQMVTDVKREESGIPKNELFAKDCEDQEVNLKEEGSGDCNEMSGITGVDATESMEEKSEVVSAEKLDVIIDGELELENTAEVEACVDSAVEVKPEEICNNTEYPGEEDMVNVRDDATESLEEKSEVVSAEKQDITIDGELELESNAEVESCVDSAVEVTPEEEICNNTEYPGDEDMVNVVGEAQHIEGSVDVCTAEAEAKVELDGESQNVHLETNVDASSHEASFGEEVEVVVLEDDDKEMGCEDMNVTLIELRVQSEEVKQTESDEMKTLQIEESEKTADGKLNGEEAAAAEVVEPTRMSGYSDNKENNVSEEVVVMNEKMKPSAEEGGESVVDLKELSIAKLTKMLKEKLEITKKTSKHGNEVSLPRTALQALPENH